MNDHARLLDAANELLAQGEALLTGLSPADYVQPSAPAFGASIGAHYRHCLDHFALVLRGLESGCVDYDDRARDPRLEQSPAFAATVTGDLRRQFSHLRSEELARPVSCRCQLRYGLDPGVKTDSTLARELVYSLAHAIHHFALIAVIARLHGLALPADFGLAPSTKAHRDKAASALAFAA